MAHTIVGTLAFVGRYLFTSWTLLTAPGKIVNYINRSREDSRLARPFTYVAVTTLIGSILLREIILQYALQTEPTELQEAIGDALLTLSIRGMFETFFPTAIAVATMALLLVVVFGRDTATRASIVVVTCYATGYQLLLITMAAGVWMAINERAVRLEERLGDGIDITDGEPTLTPPLFERTCS